MTIKLYIFIKIVAFLMVSATIHLLGCNLLTFDGSNNACKVTAASGLFSWCKESQDYTVNVWVPAPKFTFPSMTFLLHKSVYAHLGQKT